jgi:phage-related protein
VPTSTYHPSIDPTFNTPLTITPRTIKNEFGGGYRQEFGDGLNTIKEIWSVAFEDVSVDDAETLDNFYRAQKGYLSFYWTPPDRAFNQALYSERFDLWSTLPGGGTAGAFITANAITGPLGGATQAQKLNEDTSTSQHFVTQVLPTVFVGDHWWLSVYVRAAERTQVWLTSYAEGFVVFDLSTQSVVSNTNNYQTSITNVGGGWYRIAARIVKSNTNGGVYVGLSDNWALHGSVYTGSSGSGVYLWGFQADNYDRLRAYQVTGAALILNQFKCPTWQKQKNSATTATVTAQFEQVFDL